MSSVESTSDARTVNNTMRHQYRVLSDDEKAAMVAIKDNGLEFLELVGALGTSRELSIAKTKIEEAVMWAMTTSIKIQSHNYPVLVRLVDRSRNVYDGTTAGKSVKVTSESVTVTDQILWPEDGEQFFHCTTSRSIECVDLDYDDPRAVASKPPSAAASAP